MNLFSLCLSAILPVVLNWRETWSLAFMMEHGEGSSEKERRCRQPGDVAVELYVCTGSVLTPTRKLLGFVSVMP